MTANEATSQLDTLLPAEIKGDRFWRAIARIAATPGVESILEIGASSGEGSTSALVAGALTKTPPPTLYCIELSRTRYEELAARYRAYGFVRPYNISSVRIERFPSIEELADFCRRTWYNLRRRSLQTQTRWLQQDLAYLREHGASVDGIRQIKAELGIDTFDAVLIDGSEFTGKAELEDVYGARFLLLDDILTFKNYDNYHRLRKDPDYRMVEKSRRLRNGYAVFERRG